MTELNYGFKKRALRWRLVVLMLCILSFIFVACELCLGSVSYPVSDVIRVLMGETVDGVSYAVNHVRLPRMMALPSALPAMCFKISCVTPLPRLM